MRTEDFKHGVILILLVFALVFSMISVAPLASSGDWVNNPEPGGTTIEVVQGDNFLIRHVLEWDDGADGAYTVTIAWINYDNDPSENLTFLMAEAYFTTGSYTGESTQADVTLSSAPDGENTKWALSVNRPSENKDPRNGQFNVDIWMGAYGVGGVPHISTDNHPILDQFAGVIIFESSMGFWNRAPITIRVLGRGVSVSISPLEGSAEPGRTLTSTVTVTNTGSVFDNYILTVSDDAGWGATLAQNLLTIPAGGNRTTTVSVTVPSDADGNELTQITVVTSSQLAPTVSDSAEATAKSLVTEGIPLAVLLAISAFLIGAAILVMVYLLRGRPKKGGTAKVAQRYKFWCSWGNT